MQIQHFIKITITIIALVANCAIYAQNSKGSIKKLPWDTERVRKAQAGDADAQAYVGWCYYLGEDGVLEDNAEAIRWLKKSTLGGSPYGKYYLGLAYLNGFGVTKDRVKGRKYCDTSNQIIEDRANQGDPEAQFYIGESYRYEADDYKTALKYYIPSAEQGFIQSQEAAAEVYIILNGNLSKKAFQWYSEALKKNSPKAQFAFAEYYEGGFGVEKSLPKAIELYKQSAENGYFGGMAGLGKCYEEGLGIEQNIVEAIKWYKKAIEFDNAFAEYRLACLYRDGIGVDRNYHTALKYMKLSARHEEPIAQKALKELQDKGPLYYKKLPLRAELEEEIVLTDDDPFLSMVLSDNWNELSEELKRSYLLHFKKEKIKEWGKDRATKVAQHVVEIGFTEEQLKYSQGISPQFYKAKTVHYPNGKMRIIEYPHCIYYLINDKLIAMLWSNGLQVGDTTVIKTYSGDYVVIDENP